MKLSTENKGAQSIPPDAPATQSPARAGGTGVAASPMNGVKLDLAVILLLAVALLLTSVVFDWPGPWGLGGYSVLSAIWLVWRTRRVLQKSQLGLG